MGMHNSYNIRDHTEIRLDRVNEAIHSLRKKKMIKPKPNAKGQYEVLIADYEVRIANRNRKKVVRNYQKKIIDSITKLILTIPEEMREKVQSLHHLPRSQIVKETGLTKVQVCLILDKLRTDGKLPRRTENDDDIALFNRD